MVLLGLNSVCMKPGSSFAGELWLFLLVVIWPCACLKVSTSSLLPAASCGSRHQWLSIEPLELSSSCLILKPWTELICQCIVAWCSEVLIDAELLWEGVGLGGMKVSLEIFGSFLVYCRQIAPFCFCPFWNHWLFSPFVPHQCSQGGSKFIVKSSTAVRVT